MAAQQTQRWFLRTFAVVILAINGCSSATSHRPISRDHRVLTASDIQRNGCKTAIEAIRLIAPRAFNASDAARAPDSGPRGRSTFLLTDQPMVFLDGVQVADVRELGDMPASDIAWIRVMSGIDGSIRYGTGGGNGAIIIRTKR